MATLRLEGHVDREGELVLRLPPDFHESDVRVEVETQSSQVVHRPDLSEEQWAARVREAAGSFGDIDFIEPEDAPPDVVEPIFR